MNAKFCIGIDLGTTNSVVAYSPVDSSDERRLLPIPQIVGPSQVESRDSLPSFLYLPRDGEIETLGSDMEHDPTTGIAGHYARAQAAENPQRVVVAAKSWLCHSDHNPQEEVLPWQSPDEVGKTSAYRCSVKFLKHLVCAWNTAHPEAPIADQHVVLTVPASFAPSARQWTHQAAIEAGLPESFVLLEEPQAAVYQWLGKQGDAWRQTLKPDDRLLVVDVGGGTTDLTLVNVSQADGELHLERLAVGNHCLLGGDNMDLALAYLASTKFADQGHTLDPWQSTSLWHACRDAKEKLLSREAPESTGGPESSTGDPESTREAEASEENTHTISVLGRGSSLIGGTISVEITRREAAAVIIDGFFPLCDAAARPEQQPASGFQDVGLPYESDAAITKHVAAFLADQKTDGGQPVQPTHVLFNGGVFQSEALRHRMQDAIGGWCDSPPVVLGGVGDLNTAVAVGASFYGASKLGGGIRIRGGTARSYYVGIETAGLAIPGMPRPLRALCVAHRGMEEGTEVDVPADPVGIVVGQPAQFRFFSSSIRTEDKAGDALQQWSSPELVEVEPISVRLDSESVEGNSFVPVRFVSRITELGMFELWCHSTQADEAWKMEFNAREDVG